MRNKKPSKQAGIPTKNESNKGDSKGIDLRIELSNEREKNLLLESEIKRLKAAQAKQELRDKDHAVNLDRFFEDNEKYLLEVERLLALVPSFAQWGYKLEDKEFNQKLSHSLFKNSSPRERVIYCTKLLEEAIPRYRKHFDKGLKKGQAKIHGTEREFLQWAETNKDWIIKRLNTGRGAKKHIFLIASESIQISQSSFYDYLKIHFSGK